MNARIDERLERIDAYYGAASPETREKADEIIPWSDIYRLTDEDQFLRFLRNHVEEEFQSRKNGDREKPLCRCSDRACPPKYSGDLPPQILPRRGALDDDQDVEDLVDRYVTGDHEDVVIGEGLDEWIDRHAAVLPKLTRAVGILEDDVEGSRGLLEV